MDSPFGGATDARQRSPQGNGNRAECHVQDFRNLAIPQPLGPENETSSILFRKRLYYGHHDRAGLMGRELILGIWIRIDNKFARRQERRRNGLEIAAVIAPLPERKIVSHTEQPAAKIFP